MLQFFKNIICNNSSFSFEYDLETFSTISNEKNIELDTFFNFPNDEQRNRYNIIIKGIIDGSLHSFFESFEMTFLKVNIPYIINNKIFFLEQKIYPKKTCLSECVLSLIFENVILKKYRCEAFSFEVENMHYHYDNQIVKEIFLTLFVDSKEGLDLCDIDLKLIYYLKQNCNDFYIAKKMKISLYEFQIEKNNLLEKLKQTFHINENYDLIKIL